MSRCAPERQPPPYVCIGITPNIKVRAIGVFGPQGHDFMNHSLAIFNVINQYFIK
jgi:hypothetical protein